MAPVLLLIAFVIGGSLALVWGSRRDGIDLDEEDGL